MIQNINRSPKWNLLNIWFHVVKICIHKHDKVDSAFYLLWDVSAFGLNNNNKWQWWM